jgi:hypothetical protein
MRSYINPETLPKSVREGRVLMHNHLRHKIDTPCDVNGFHAWTDTKPLPDFVPCPCGWSGLPHYAHRDYVKRLARQGKGK